MKVNVHQNVKEIAIATLFLSFSAALVPEAFYPFIFPIGMLKKFLLKVP